MKAAQLLDAPSLRQWTRLRPYRNLMALAVDWTCAIALAVGVMVFFHNMDTWGISLWWCVPVSIATFLINGCLIHRIGLMGHEASHYMLVSNRKWNDVLADLLCFFPIWSSLVQYRNKHLNHHLYPNNPGKDPNLAGEKAEELFAKFPMPKPAFIYQYYLKFFWPPFVFRNLLDLLNVLTLGGGLSPVDPEKDVKEPARKSGAKGVLGNTTVLGFAYLLLLVGFIYLSEFINIAWLVVAMPITWYAIAVAIWARMPEEKFVLPAKLNYNAKISALVRMSFYTVFFLGVSWTRHFVGIDFALYFIFFWIFPLIYVFPYLMLLREIYQHANLGQGQLDNSRIIHSDWFTRWALLGYGNDFHLIHHIYPNIPHYHLRGAHSQLLEVSEDYRTSVEEAHGTFHAPPPKEAVLDVMARQKDRA